MPNPRIFIDVFGDASGQYWHHRILLQTDGKGLQAVVTPTGAVQVCDLSVHRVLPLDQKELIPVSHRGQALCFDPVSPARLAEYVRRGGMLVAVRGIASGAPGVADTRWRIADPAHAAFASVIPESAVADPACFVAREGRALALVDREWVRAEAVEVGGEEAWRLATVTAFGRDPRVTGFARDKRGVPLGVSEEVAPTKFENQKIEHFLFLWSSCGCRVHGELARPGAKR